LRRGTDIAGSAGLGYADFAKVEIPADLKNLMAWRARVAERPSTAHA
jgi:glutathione S-transferase